MRFSLCVAMLAVCFIAVQCAASGVATDDGSENDSTPVATIPAAPVVSPPLSASNDPDPDSGDKDCVDSVNHADDCKATASDGEKDSGNEGDSRSEKGNGDKKGSTGEDSSDLFSPHSENGSGGIPGTATTPNKPVTQQKQKETPTRGATVDSSGSPSLLPTPQNPTSNGTPAAKLTRAHTTEPAKPGHKQPSEKVITMTTTTNSAAKSAQKPKANPAEKETTQLKTLKSTTSTAVPKQFKKTSAPSTIKFSRGESTASPTSLPKMSKAVQYLDMKDSSIGSSSCFALAALATFVVMTIPLAC